MLIISSLLCLISLTACPKPLHDTQEQPEQQYKFTKDGSLTIQDAQGKQIGVFDIEIASTVVKRQIGLMYRESMEPNQECSLSLTKLILTGFG